MTLPRLLALLALLSLFALPLLIARLLTLTLLALSLLLSAHQLLQLPAHSLDLFKSLLDFAITSRAALLLAARTSRFFVTRLCIRIQGLLRSLHLIAQPFQILRCRLLATQHVLALTAADPIGAGLHAQLCFRLLQIAKGLAHLR